jgi:uncharacterized membrane protein YphA (DoxX/SURF4 family)
MSMIARSRRNLALWVLSGLSSVLFLLAGVAKITGAQAMRDGFESWGYPPWFMYVVGVCEILGGVLVVMPSTRVHGALLLAVVMLGAVWTHLVNGETTAALMPLAVLGVLGAVLWMRRPSARPEREPLPEGPPHRPHEYPKHA